VRSGPHGSRRPLRRLITMRGQSVANSTRRANHQFQSSDRFKNILLYRNQNREHNRSRPAPTEGRFAIVTIRRAQDAMDAAAPGDFSPDENVRSGRRNRVVLTPRPWRQAGAKYRAGDGGNKRRSPGRAPISRKPLRGESRDVSAVPVVNPCAFIAHFLHTGLRAQSAPGFPCALFSRRGTTNWQHSGEIEPRERSWLSLFTQ
jgi:hypothetical protein